MEFEILDKMPVSGVYEEYGFGTGYEFLPVVVRDNDCLEYCAKFATGVGRLSRILPLGTIAFVIAKGKGYLVDLQSRVLIEDTEIENLTNVLACNDKKLFIACNNTNLFVFGVSGFIWSSNRVSSDGIELHRIRDGELRGRIFNFMEWVDFKLDLSTLNYQCDWICEEP